MRLNLSQSFMVGVIALSFAFIYMVISKADAHQGHAVVSWSGNYELYVKCLPDQYAVTKWRMILGDFQDYLDAQVVGDHALWIADKNHVETFQPNTLVAEQTPNGGGLIIWPVYTFDNHINFKWTGTKFGNGVADSISIVDMECRTNQPDVAHVPQSQ